MIFDLDLIQQEFQNYGFNDTFEKFKLKLLFICEQDTDVYFNFYMLSDALFILKGRNYNDFSFAEMVAAIEQAEKDEMDYEDYLWLSHDKVTGFS
jgi:hypothetical protein